MSKNDTIWVILIGLSIVLNLTSMYISWKMNQRWDKMYKTLNEDVKQHPVIEQGYQGTIRFDVINKTQAQ